MNTLRLALLTLLLPTTLWAQTNPTPAPKAAAKPSASRAEIKAKAKDLAVAMDAAEAALSPGEMAIAERVHVGTMPCELGNSVTLTADPKAPGYFDVHMQKMRFRMFPVETSTGAVRLEDHKAGAVWLQLANKSMLMSQKLGKRLADECLSPAQSAYLEAVKKNPVPSVLDAPKTEAPPKS